MFTGNLFKQPNTSSMDVIQVMFVLIESSFPRIRFDHANFNHFQSFVVVDLKLINEAGCFPVETKEKHLMSPFPPTST